MENLMSHSEEVSVEVTTLVYFFFQGSRAKQFVTKVH